MKYLLFILLIASLFACNQQKNEARLQSQIDSLQRKVAESYSPGFGEFMTSIQLHHEKLWYAGINQNWKLADFELHEITEMLEDIQKYQKDRKESQMIPMLNPALDGVAVSVGQKDSTVFRNNFQILTNTCNKCHEASQYEFIKVKVPATINCSNNQEYKLQDSD